MTPEPALLIRRGKGRERGNEGRRGETGQGTVNRDFGKRGDRVIKRKGRRGEREETRGDVSSEEKVNLFHCWSSESLIKKEKKRLRSGFLHHKLLHPHPGPKPQRHSLKLRRSWQNLEPHLPVSCKTGREVRFDTDCESQLVNYTTTTQINGSNEAASRSDLPNMTLLLKEAMRFCSD